MQLPIIVIPEEHWDALAKRALLEALPMLNQLGYDTLCLEKPVDYTQQEIMDEMEQIDEASTEMLKYLERLLKSKGALFDTLLDYDLETVENFLKGNSTAATFEEKKQLAEVIYTITELPGIRMTRTVLKKILALGGKVNGIDLPKEQYKSLGSQYEYTHSDSVMKLRPKICAPQHKEARELSFCTNLLRLQREGRGLIFFGGINHIESLLLKFDARSFLGEVIVIHPYSLIDKIKHGENRALAFKHPTLKNKIHFLESVLENQADILVFIRNVERLVRPIIESFYKEVPDHSIAKTLGARLGIDFKAQIRPSFFVDCIHKIEGVEKSDEIVEQLMRAGFYARITTSKEKKYLCVPEVNEKGIDKKILAL